MHLPVVDISSGELIPGKLLLSRARFRFSSQQNSYHYTIFTTCRKRQPHSKGFTDSDGSEQYNLSLSEKRVMAVRQVLIENQVDSAKIQISYFGESNSLNQNTLESDRLENRRVEINIIRPNK